MIWIVSGNSFKVAGTPYKEGLEKKERKAGRQAGLGPVRQTEPDSCKKFARQTKRGKFYPPNTK